MKRLRIPVMCFGALMSCGVAALAGGDWKTETLGGEPGLTISIPAVAENEIGKKNGDDLLFFSIVSATYGGLTCTALRMAYPKDTSPAAFAARLNSDRRNVFCDEDRAKVSDFEVAGSKSFMQNGMQAAACTASFTDSTEKMPGRVSSQLVIAAPKKIHVLTCVGEGEDLEDAQVSWSMYWDERVSHMQDSFHVPK